MFSIYIGIEIVLFTGKNTEKLSRSLSDGMFQPLETRNYFSGVDDIAEKFPKESHFFLFYVFSSQKILKGS